MISHNFSQLGLRPCRLSIKRYHARFRAIMVKYNHEELNSTQFIYITALRSSKKVNHSSANMFSAFHANGACLKRFTKNFCWIKHFKTSYLPIIRTGFAVVAVQEMQLGEKPLHAIRCKRVSAYRLKKLFKIALSFTLLYELRRRNRHKDIIHDITSLSILFLLQLSLGLDL